MKRILSNTVVRLLIAVVVGIVLGLFVPAEVMKVIMVIKQISGQIIFFLVPLIIVGFVAPSIASLKGNVTRLLVVAFLLAYSSSVGAAFFAAGAGYELLPLLNIQPATEGARPLPELLFNLEIPPVLNVMSALLIAVFVGLGTIWSGAETVAQLLGEFQKIVLQLVNRILVPVLPFFVASNFCALSYQGAIAQLGIFLPVLLMVIIGHYIWLALLYGLASLYSGKNGWRVLKHYAPAYVTALGTMSSAATLGVAIGCARKSDILDREVTDFSIPLFANIHLCGSVLTEVLFVCVVSQMLYGVLPSVSSIILFILLLGVFAVGAPGVPGGTVLASLGIVISVLGFDDSGTALLITIFALQDSFGTACNVTGDGALSLILTTFNQRQQKKIKSA
jgi:Na+/H+-dicarboxylate symporter